MQNLLVGGTISSAVQLAAVRRSMDQVRSLLGEVRVCAIAVGAGLAAMLGARSNGAGQVPSEDGAQLRCSRLIPARLLDQPCLHSVDCTIFLPVWYRRSRPA